MQTAKRLAVTKTELPPCCLRVHPDNHSLVFLGTYKLEKETRHGSVDVYSTDGGSLEKKESVTTASAVLDLKFSPFDSKCLISAHSTGELIVWSYTDELNRVSTLSIAEEDNLVTSIFFSPVDSNKLLATLTSGSAVIVDLHSGQVDSFSATHDLECWTGAFGEAGPCQNVVFSGGDDAALIAHDLRTMDKIWSTGYRHHDAGVVSILCPSKKWLSHRPNDLWTGSYDDHLRVFDLRYLSGDDGPTLYSGLLPTESHKQNLGGGVWRLIPSPDSDDVLACCMYDGARIIRPESASFSVTRYFKADHESMCYGGDWQNPKEIVTCSFYDNVVQSWSPTDIK